MSKKVVVENEKFDKKIINILIRCFKEDSFISRRSYVSQIKRLCRSKKDLLNKCLTSRNSHRSEGVYINASYWPGDVGFSFSTPMLQAVYDAKLVSFFEKEKREMPDMAKKFFSNAITQIIQECLVSGAISLDVNNDNRRNSEETFIYNINVIKEALDICNGDSKHNNDIVELCKFCVGKKLNGIPF